MKYRNNKKTEQCKKPSQMATAERVHVPGQAVPVVGGPLVIHSGAMPRKLRILQTTPLEE